MIKKLLSMLRKRKDEYYKLSEELAALNGGFEMYWKGVVGAFNEVITLVEKMEEEHASSDLEEAAIEHAVERFRTTRDEFLAEKCKWSFITGAKYYKKLMMKNSFDAVVCKGGNTYLREMDKNAIAKALAEYNDLDKVKVIIIKEADK